VRRVDAIASLAATLRDAEEAARKDLAERDDPNDDRQFLDFMAERLVRYAPANGLSIRLDDGREIPAV
jgi:hypothetical protein